MTHCMHLQKYLRRIHILHKKTDVKFFINNVFLKLIHLLLQEYIITANSIIFIFIYFLVMWILNNIIRIFTMQLAMQNHKFL